MNVIQQARQAYAPARPAVQTPRAIEAQLLTSITARLMQKAASHSHYVRAVHENRTLWTTLAIDVADAENRLPRTLRAQIFYLAEFTQVHSQKFLKGEADLGPLVEVNTAIIRGLNSREAN